MTCLIRYETRTTRRIVVPVGEPLFSEQATTIEITDEAGGGEFVVISQDAPGNGYTGRVAITGDDWPQIRDAIDKMIGQCREDDE